MVAENSARNDRNEKSTILIEFDSYITRQREKEQDKVYNGPPDVLFDKKWYIKDYDKNS